MGLLSEKIMIAVDEKILITTALPYANGMLHLGHLFEHIQADIFARFAKEFTEECYFICATDAHGTPIMLSAKQQNITPQELVVKFNQLHQEDLAKFSINYDNFYTTHSSENQQLANKIYSELVANEDIEQREVEQFFDKDEKMFLPDRYVRGQCPKCDSKEQYGDACEVCGAHYKMTELKNPISILSNKAPILKKSKHYFFKLEKYQEFLMQYVAKDKVLQKQVANKLQEWFEDGLQQWNISRDAPYFGFKIPDTEDKYFYVWLDAPVGYMSSFMHYCANNNLDFDSFWKQTSKAKIYHFIGKDIIYFHALFWPAMLKGAKFNLPTSIFVHGFLTVNSEKMSKSRGTFIEARQFAKHVEPEFLRYYFATKLNDTIEDVDLCLSDMVQKVNADLIGKYVNIASRVSGFINKFFAGKLIEHEKIDGAAKELVQNLLIAAADVNNFYAKRQFSKAMRLIMEQSDLINKYIGDNAPWNLVKESSKLEQAHIVCSTAIECFRILSCLLSPVLVHTTLKVEKLLICTIKFNAISMSIWGQAIATYEPLLQRLDMQQINEMLEENKSPATDTDSSTMDASSLTAAADTLDLSPQISIDDFAKVDLRIARIVFAEEVPGADKLLKLMLDIGEKEPRQVFAGIKSAYNIDKLQGKLTVMVANLAPRKMRFGVSQGMVLAASGESGIYILEPHTGAEPGMRVK